MFRFTGRVASTPTGKPGVGWDSAAEIIVYADSKPEANKKVLEAMDEASSGHEWGIAWQRIEEVNDGQE